MSIISKLKGAKKAADDHKAKAETQETKPAATAPYRHVPTHAATDAMTSSPGGWKAEEIAYQNKARLSRIGSDYSTRPSTTHTTTSRSSRPGFNRANSDSSLDFTPSTQAFTLPVRSTGSSMKSASVSRNTSFQGLEKVMESNDRDQEPVFAAALLANRTKASRSPRGSARSSVGKSPLSSVESSAESSPAESENSSPSGSSSGQIELRSEAVAYAPSHEIHPGRRVNQMLVEQPQTQRKYFGHNKAPSSEANEVPVPAPVVKKERFSFLKKGSGAVAAH
ncbi:MAG: DUF914-domain-containing protein [Aureobasidium pullulans]|uniref:Uncharacterized protein n=1 Tax=Aureobasidium pullulans TaxID=5580 RepID=A0A1A7MPQ5_AURPU|nr:MAG: DUF914-domain-containing protein [Aureobasidium pullulans]THZ54283.1 hypothetical protein D6C90_00104 [Aureobasidium pullulans]